MWARISRPATLPTLQRLLPCRARRCPPILQDEYIVTSELAQPDLAARGGETLLEPTCTPSEDDDPCHFQHFPGTVGYKLGLELIRNAPVKDDGSELTSSD